MASRKIILATGEIYHIFNRSVSKEPIFTNTRGNRRFLDTINFYRFQDPYVRYSHFIRMQDEFRSKILENMYTTGIQNVTIFAFSLMPNHFHLLIRQEQESGIKKFMSQIQNSYAKYYNTKNDRSGSVFQEMFKAVRIETDEQFIHVARYVHLNPVTGYLLKDPTELETYPWTSFGSYVGNLTSEFIDTNTILSHFKNTQELKQFTFDQANYQRKLDNIKHLTLE